MSELPLVEDWDPAPDVVEALSRVQHLPGVLLLDSALPHLPVGSLTLTVHDAEFADSAQLSSITAESAVDTSEKRIGWLRRTVRRF